MRSDKAQVLVDNFEPGKWDVICGRGKRSFNHFGNRRFRILVAVNLRSYVSATSQLQKAIIIKRIVDQIREASPNGGFVERNVNGQWYEIGTERAREKVGHTLRDSMTGALLRKNSQYSCGEKEVELRHSQDSIFRACRLKPRLKKLAKAKANPSKRKYNFENNVTQLSICQKTSIPLIIPPTLQKQTF